MPSTELSLIERFISNHDESCSIRGLFKDREPLDDKNMNRLAELVKEKREILSDMRVFISKKNRAIT